uniref:Mobile element protein n=1 Tax=Klebsiella pneumoniae TaxID=573 RepID=A0A6G9HTP8_KLEPN|nr:Mobile element protein [Klebsiella pneumoniae]QIQ16033.1 Mobile element protein [Klebsiella pneumoniae]
MHLAVDSKTHEIICADLSLNNVTDSEAFPGLIRQTHRKIRAASADGAYDPRLCHDELRRKKISALIPPRKGAGYWPGDYADRNRAVANQRMTGSNARWKWTTDYNRRSIAETAMYRVKQLFGGSLTLRDYDGQVAEAMALVRALNKMTKCSSSSSDREYLFFSITLSRVSFDVQRRSRKIHSCFVISFLYPEASLVFNFTNNANFFQALWPVPFCVR